MHSYFGLNFGEKKKKGKENRSRKQRKWFQKNSVNTSWFGNTLKTTTQSSLQKCDSMHQPRNHYFFIGSAFNFEIKSKWLCMDKFHVFVYMLMQDASLKQRIPCIILTSIFGRFSVGKKCTLYMGKYGMFHWYLMLVNTNHLLRSIKTYMFLQWWTTLFGTLLF